MLPLVAVFVVPNVGFLGAFAITLFPPSSVILALILILRYPVPSLFTKFSPRSFVSTSMAALGAKSSASPIRSLTIRLKMFMTLALEFFSVSSSISDSAARCRRKHLNQSGDVNLCTIVIEHWMTKGSAYSSLCMPRVRGIEKTS